MAGVPKIDPEVLTEFKIDYCQTKKVHVVGVKRKDGLYFKYFFDHVICRFRAHQCLDCQPTVTEDHLFPLHSVYCEDIDKHVIFTMNSLTAQIEQYEFNRATNGFEQIFCPYAIFQRGVSPSRSICAIRGTGNYGMTIIYRSLEGQFIKLRLINILYGYVKLPPVPVVTLLMKPREAGVHYEEKSQPEKSSPHDFPPFVHQYCTGFKKEIICAQHEDGTFFRFIFTYTHGDFEFVNCIQCHEVVEEKDLYPIYSQFWAPINKHVIFVRNHVTLKREQYIFNIDKCCFEQVQIPELVYDPHKEIVPMSVIVANYPDDECTMSVEVDDTGRIQKVLRYLRGEQPCLVAPEKVLTLRVKWRAGEEERKRKEKEEQGAEEKTMPTFVPDSFDDPETLKILKLKHEELLKEIRQRKDELRKNEIIPRQTYRNILAERVQQKREIENIFKKHKPEYLPEGYNVPRKAGSTGSPSHPAESTCSADSLANDISKMNISSKN